MEQKKEITACIIMIFLLIGTISYGQVTLKQISNKELVTLVEKKNIQLVDVRTPKEVANGKIQNALNLNFYDADFEAKIGKLDQEKPIVVYCAAGVRSNKAAQKLEKLGFKTIYDLKGGFRNWEKEGFPVSKE